MAVLFSDNFDGETAGNPPANWEPEVPFPPITLNISNARSVSPPNSMYLTQGVSSLGMAKNKLPIPNMFDRKLSFRLMGWTSGNQLGIIVDHYDGDYNSLRVFHNFKVDATGNLLNYSGVTSAWIDSGADFSEGMKVTFLFKSATRKFDMWVDDVQIVFDGDPWDRQPSETEMIMFRPYASYYGGGLGESWWDDITIETLPTPAIAGLPFYRGGRGRPIE